jgi:hypothetical protein
LVLRRAREANDQDGAKRLEEAQQAEAPARAEMMRNALEKVIAAREAVWAAEQQRLAAVKAAEDATRAAEALIGTKREAASPTTVAALPKIETPKSLASFDGA